MSKEKILESWEVNASEWIHAIENETIASRAITNPAIVNLIEKARPSKILDVGCGEGWLSRKLHELGIQVTGIDGTQDLIDKAKLNSTIPFFAQSFEQIIAGDLIQGAPFEAVVFNFCLYLENEVEQLLQSMSVNLKGRKLIFIQTLHPLAFVGSGFRYENQWLDNSWKGLVGAFTSPHRWYYRTLEGWQNTFEESGLRLLNLHEPLLEDKSKPASIIFTLTPKDD